MCIRDSLAGAQLVREDHHGRPRELKAKDAGAAEFRADQRRAGLERRRRTPAGKQNPEAQRQASEGGPGEED